MLEFFIQGEVFPIPFLFCTVFLLQVRLPKKGANRANIPMGWGEGPQIGKNPHIFPILFLGGGWEVEEVSLTI